MYITVLIKEISKDRFIRAEDVHVMYSKSSPRKTGRLDFSKIFQKYCFSSQASFSAQEYFGTCIVCRVVFDLGEVWALLNNAAGLQSPL